MRFPRAIRLDQSDTRIFERAAEPGEWAVCGAFAFADADPDSLAPKQRQAFAHGFLGTASFGRTTLVEVAEIGDAEYEAVIERLALHFITDYGAPDLAAALPAAREEAAFAASLCDHKLHTLLAVERAFTDDGIAESFREITPARAPGHAKIWSIVEDDA
ncbi:MAG: hypothetical protein IH906_07940 [Proteobacteria bacterium]|nr:hypothetical protein [Pseudomonadota bacterium]